MSHWSDLEPVHSSALPVIVTSIFQTFIYIYLLYFRLWDSEVDDLLWRNEDSPRVYTKLSSKKLSCNTINEIDLIGVEAVQMFSFLRLRDIRSAGYYPYVYLVFNMRLRYLELPLLLRNVRVCSLCLVSKVHHACGSVCSSCFWDTF